MFKSLLPHEFEGMRLPFSSYVLHVRHECFHLFEFLFRCLQPALFWMACVNQTATMVKISIYNLKNTNVTGMSSWLFFYQVWRNCWKGFGWPDTMWKQKSKCNKSLRPDFWGQKIKTGNGSNSCMIFSKPRHPIKSMLAQTYGYHRGINYLQRTLKNLERTFLMVH